MTASLKPYAPLPVLAFRVGITGSHILTADQTAALRPRVAMLLARVRERVTGLGMEAQRAGLYAPGGPQLRLLSSLGEGAGQLVAQEAVKQGFQLECPLPFDKGEYEKEFSDSRDSFRSLLAQAGPHVLELDGARGEEEEHSYQAAGRLIVRNCDLLLGIWDGGEAVGRDNASDVIHYSAHFGPPVWWLPSNGTDEPRWVGDVMDLRYRDELKTGEKALAALETYLASLLVPPAQSEVARHNLIGGALRKMHHHATQALHKIRHKKFVPPTPLVQFFRETELPRGGFWRLHAIAMKLAAGQWPRSDARVPPVVPPGDVYPYWDAVYQVADALAVGYAHRYRTSYLLVFILAAMALFTAMAGLGFRAWEVVGGLWELGFLGLIAVVVAVNEGRGWHSRLISYRLLAELCRKQQALAVLGWSLPAAEAIDVVDPSDVGSEIWVGWYFNAMMRAAPLPQGFFAIESKKILYSVVSTVLVAGQSAYHVKRQNEAHRGAHHLGLMGECFFFATILIGILRFVLTETDILDTNFVLCIGVAAGLLPAISAAFVGIRSYAELELIAAESAHMAEVMKRADLRLKRLRIDLPLGSQDMGAEILGLAEKMLLDIKGWARLFRVKVVEPGA